jgi:hypothetical protein
VGHRAGLNGVENRKMFCLYRNSMDGLHQLCHPTTAGHKMGIKTGSPIIGGWLGPRADLDGVENRKMSCLYRNSMDGLHQLCHPNTAGHKMGRETGFNVIYCIVTCKET